ncbi:hypothetical protein ARMGADRAFT_1004588 [Armillaria gallica]|uniref:Uncharacterized protein n=1 Tax=Armillaria gallica TaxID=47427 RepID=A0A2H3E925_ARMGA|nr:hypothetical protein ARMGADRAFT_1004588 [Armillaria gallica]
MTLCSTWSKRKAHSLLPPLSCSILRSMSRSSVCRPRPSHLCASKPSPRLPRKSSGSTPGDPLPRKRQKVSNILRVKADSPVFMSVVFRRGSIANIDQFLS